MKLFKSFGGKSKEKGDGDEQGQPSSGRGSDSTPKADVVLPRKERRRSSFLQRSQNVSITELPALEDTPPTKKEELLKQKLMICGVNFNYDDPDEDMREKEIKKNTLVELVEYVNSPSGQKIFSEAVMPDIVAMFRLPSIPAFLLSIFTC